MNNKPIIWIDKEYIPNRQRPVTKRGGVSQCSSKDGPRAGEVSLSEVVDREQSQMT